MVRIRRIECNANRNCLNTMFFFFGVVATSIYTFSAWFSYIIQVPESTKILKKYDLEYRNISFKYILYSDHEYNNSFINIDKPLDKEEELKYIKAINYISDKFIGDANESASNSYYSHIIYYNNFFKEAPIVKNDPFRVYGRLMSLHMITIEVSIFAWISHSNIIEYNYNPIARKDKITIYFLLFFIGQIGLYVSFAILLGCSLHLNSFEIIFSYFDVTYLLIATPIMLLFSNVTASLFYVNVLMAVRKVFNLIALLVFYIKYVNLDLNNLSFNSYDKNMLENFYKSNYSMNKILGIISFIAIILSLIMHISMAHCYSSLRFTCCFISFN